MVAQGGGSGGGGGSQRARGVVQGGLFLQNFLSPRPVSELSFSSVCICRTTPMYNADTRGTKFNPQNIFKHCSGGLLSATINAKNYPQQSAKGFVLKFYSF